MKLAWLVVLLALSGGLAEADEIRPAYLQISEVEADTYQVVWKVPAIGGNQRLSLDVQFAEDVARREPSVDAFVDDAHIQRFMVRREGGLSGSRIAIAGLKGTSTEAILRVENLDGTSILHRITPDATTYIIEQAPTVGQVIWTYLVLGIEHILIGVDHLLFVLVLLLLVKGVSRLIWTITAFTLAHSITLSLASLGVISVPVPPVEACIALSIVFVATEIIHGMQGRPGITARKPWIVAFTFGLLHGLGFAAALGQIGLPQTSIPQALLFFNVGVEIGQLIFVAFVLGVMWVAGRLSFNAPKWWPIVPPYVIGSLASFWVIERTAGFWG